MNRQCVRRGVFALLMLVAMSGWAGKAAAQDASRVQTGADSLIFQKPAHKNMWRALGEITVVNAGVLAYNYYIRPGGGEGFKVGWNSWEEALRNSFDWDPNNFTTNQFAHPYHGALYFNAGRSNGFDYYESVGLAFAGSFQWEYFGESRHPSFNDWINTSMGGVALGEMTHRLAATVRDNRATGGRRFWTELGGLAIDPIGGLTRILNGDISRVQPNPEIHYPSSIGVIGRFGSRTTYENQVGDVDTTHAFVNLDFLHGEPFQAKFERPYDVFHANVQINFKDVKALGLVHVEGMLSRKFLDGGTNAKHVLGLYQYYDYMYNRSFELGGQSIGGALDSRFPASRDGKTELATTFMLAGIVLGATKSDYVNQTDRSYDYGPGATAAFRGVLTRNGDELLALSHTQVYIHSLNGNRANHFLSVSRVAVGLPITRGLVLGADYQLYLADRNYADFPDVKQRSPQLEFYLRTKL
jgi:hypothetical protein